MRMTILYRQVPRRRCVRLRTTLTQTVAALMILGCSDSTSPDLSGTFFGPIVTMASGTGRVYVTLDRAGLPTELGLAISELALTGLPTTAAEYVFAVPAQASATPYKHAAINWLPVGHPPAGIYTVPHFDFHFYSITDAQRSLITLGDSSLTAKMMRLPAAEFVPTGYAAGMAAALMGLHWNDPDAPERKGEPFTRTFIYGSYDGAFIFAEPMIAKAYLETKPAAVLTSIKQPAQYSARGYQPTSYSVGYDASAKEYRIAITGLVSR
jgi:hypothetical protein